uniref:Uncharacterized protein n=1 Tax=Arundo donax TaxID=35708 RepID=A0A0A9AI50_ARUDO
MTNWRFEVGSRPNENSPVDGSSGPLQATRRPPTRALWTSKNLMAGRMVSVG